VVRAGVVAVAGGVALVAAGVALADKARIARTPAGNARARSEVLLRSDLGKGWSGGFKKPDFSSGLRCSYKPKQSDLVVIGAAETMWDRPTTYEIGSEAQVLRTAAMVRRDWRRTVIAPQVLPCLRKTFTEIVGSSGKVLSVRRVAFPHLTTYTRAFRFLATLGTGSSRERFESDFVALGAGRNEVSLTLTAAGGNASWLRTQELRLARVLAHRMHS
jgi:hypothetical protein